MSQFRIQVSVVLMACALAATAAAQVPYNLIPDWYSSENSEYGTGCDLGDINGDLWLDLAVSNGNDMAEAPNFVYLNNLGVLPNSASWVSGDELFSGHCELGDIDSDGYPEFMVVNYISVDWEPGTIQIYNNQDGVLETTPSWQAADPVYSFRATFGDPDGDGDLDLAVATGESYRHEYHPNLIFFNEGGVLSTTPGWTSADSDASYDARFVDIDNDGDQDLAMLTSGGPVKIYFNTDGVMATSPGWVTTEEESGNTFDFADVNGDGWLDLGVANNSQLGGSGRFKIYYSQAGVLPTTADWQSDWLGYGSAIAFVDLDTDGDQDFVGGSWWGPVVAYLNEGGTFPTASSWSSAESTVIENIVFGDLDGSGAISGQYEFSGDGLTSLFDLGVRHLQSVDQVAVGGADLALDQYCYDLEAGWVSLGAAPNEAVVIHYRHSRYPDMAVSNWDDATIVFNNNQLTPVPDTAPQVTSTIAHRAYPNPFNPRVVIEYELPRAAQVQLDIVDLRGRKVASLVQKYQTAGSHTAAWTATDFASGRYLYQLRADGQATNGSLQLVK